MPHFTQMIDAQVRRDPKKPAREWPAQIECGECSERSYERLLGDVLRLLFVTHLSPG